MVICLRKEDTFWVVNIETDFVLRLNVEGEGEGEVHSCLAMQSKIRGRPTTADQIVILPYVVDGEVHLKRNCNPFHSCGVDSWGHI